MANFTSSDKLYYHWTNGWSDGITIGTSKANGYAAKPNNGSTKTGRTILDFSITPSSSKTITSLSLKLGAVKQGTGTKTYEIKGHLYAFGSASNKLTINSSVSAQDHTKAFSAKTSYYVGAATTSVTTSNQGKNFTLTWPDLNWSSAKYIQVWLECVSGTAADDDGDELEIWTYKNTSNPTAMQTASYSIVEENSISPLNIYYDLFNTDINSIVVDSASNYYVNTEDFKRIYNKSGTIYTEQINKLSTTSKHTVKDLINDFGISRPGYSCLSYSTSQGKSVSPGDQLPASGFIGAGSSDSTTYLTAQWTPQIYKITLNDNSGSGGDSAIYLKYNTGWYSESTATNSTTSVTTPTRTNFNFDGYYTAASGGTQIIDSGGNIVGSKTFTTNNTTLYAHWINNKYTLTIEYDSNAISKVLGGGSYAPDTYITIKATVNDGYQIIGWEIPTDINYQNLNGNQIAIWTPARDSTITIKTSLKTYTITYDANGGNTSSLPSNQTKTHGTTLTLSSKEPTRNNESVTGYKITFNPNGGSTTKSSETATNLRHSYALNYWNTQSNGSGTNYYPGGSYSANQNATLYAQWTYKTTFGTVTLPTREECTWSGYYLLGWSTSSTATTATYEPGESYSATLTKTLYAVWKKTTKYIIEFNGNGYDDGKLPEKKDADGTSTSVLIGDIDSNVPKKTGAVFRGWSSTSTYNDSRIVWSTYTEYGGGPDSKNNSPKETSWDWTFQDYLDETGNSTFTGTTLTLYAQWEYPINFNKNTTDTVSNMPNDGYKQHELSYDLPSNEPVRSGYTFKGWTTGIDNYQPGEQILKDATQTLYAIWEQDSVIYSITFNANGGSGTMESGEKEYEKSFPLPSSTFTPPTTKTTTFNIKCYRNDGSNRYSNNFKSKTTSYSFYQWRLNSSTGTPYVVGENYTTNANAIFYADWKAAESYSSVTLPILTRANETANGYTVNYDPNEGEEMALQGQTAIDTISYSFKGWGTDSSDTSVDYNGGESYQFTAGMDLYAIWSPNRSRGGFNLPTADDVSRIGYTLLGWSKTKTSFYATYDPGDFYTPTSDNETLYAIWSQDLFTITLDHQGGAASINSIQWQSNTGKWFNSSGVQTNSITPPSKTGYIFQGYYYGNIQLIDKNGNLLTNTSWTTKNATIVANWSPITYTIRYDNAPFTNILDTTKIVSDHTYDQPKNLNTGVLERKYKVTYDPNEGRCLTTSATVYYSLLGWDRTKGTSNNQTPEFSNEQEVINLTTINETMINLYPQWKSGSTSLPTPFREGYNFLGWYTAKIGGSKVGDAGAGYTPTENITLYAHWEQTTFSVTYDLDGGNENNAFQNQTNLTSYTIPNITPIKTNCDFAYWIIKETGAKYSPGGTISLTQNITLQAVWLGYYTITIILPSEGIDSVEFISGTSTVVAGSTVQIKAIIKDKGYYFQRWIDDNGNQLSTNATITINNINQNYIITPIAQPNYGLLLLFNKGQANFGVNGSTGSFYSIALYYNRFWYQTSTNAGAPDSSQTITQLTPPIRHGYKFTGYYLSDGTQVMDENGVLTTDYTCITGSKYANARWEPLGLVHIRVDNEWKYAIPYVYDGTEWRQAIAHVYEKKTPDSSEYEWKVSI